MNISNNELSKNIKHKNVLFIVVFARRYIGLNLTKVMKDVLTEHYKILLKEITDYL